MKGQLCFLVAALILACGAAAAEDGGPTSGWRKLGSEEVKSVLKDVGLGLRDTPTYPTTAYRLYPEPYEVFELATVGYSPWETLDGSPLNGSNPEDAKLWGPNGEPVVILRKPGAGMWMEGFFSKKRVEVDLDRYTYSYRSEDLEGPSAYPVIDVLNAPKDYESESHYLFVTAKRPSGMALADYLSRFPTASGKDNIIYELLKEIDTLPYPLGMEAKKGGKLADCEALVWSIGRTTVEDVTRRRRSDKLFWEKAIVRYFPPGQTPPKGKMPWCTQRTPLVSWPDGGQTVNHGDSSDPHLLPDGSILVKLGTDAVVRLRWEDGEPVGSLPPFIKVVDAREVIWAKLDLLRRYRDEMRARGLTDATKLRTPTQIMHDLAAYFFDIREIKNWKKGGDK